MLPHDILQPTPVRNLKRTLTNVEFNLESASKRILLSLDQLSTPSNSAQDRYSEQLNPLWSSSNWREELESSFLRSFGNHRPHINKQLTIDLRLSAWLDTVSRPRASSCPTNRIFSPPSSSSRSDYIQLQRPQNCEACIELVRHKKSASNLKSKPKRACLTVTAFQKMSQQKAQYAKSLVPQSNFSSNKTPGISNVAYIDTLYSHDIVMNFSGRRIPKKLTSLKERILQKRSSPQLDDSAVFAVMNAAKELAYNSEDSTNKTFRTPMFPLEYDGLVEGGNTQWNTVAISNNLQCDNKLSAPKFDVYLIYPRGSKSS